MFQQWPLTKMVIYTYIRGVSRMAKVKRDRKCQDDRIILTFANFKLIGFQTFVELKAVASDNILYKLQECWLVVMRFRISIEKHSKFPQALSGGGSVGIIQTCPASLPASQPGQSAAGKWRACKILPTTYVDFSLFKMQDPNNQNRSGNGQEAKERRSKMAQMSI